MWKYRAHCVDLLVWLTGLNGWKVLIRKLNEVGSSVLCISQFLVGPCNFRLALEFAPVYLFVPLSILFTGNSWLPHFFLFVHPAFMILFFRPHCCCHSHVSNMYSCICSTFMQSKIYVITLSPVLRLNSFRRGVINQFDHAMVIDDVG